MNLYLLSKQMQEIINMGYDDETTQELLEGYNIVGNDGVDDIVKTIRTLEATAVGYKHEKERIAKLEKDCNNKIESLEKLIDRFMKATNTERVDTETCKVYYTSSKQVVIDDETLLTPEYIREKITRDPDKTLIKKDIEKGIIVEGASIKINSNLQIK